MSLRTVLARELVLAQAAHAYTFGATAAGMSIDQAIGGSADLRWSAHPPVQAVGGPGAVGYVASPAALRAETDRPLRIEGSMPRTIAFAFRTTSRGEVWRFGGAAAGAGVRFALVDDGARWEHGGNDVEIPGDWATGAWRHAVLRMDRDGHCRVQVDGQVVVSMPLPAGPPDTRPGPLQLLGSATVAGIAADVAYLALWNRELSDAEVAGLALNLGVVHRLAGIAVLSDGSAADQALVRRAVDREHLLAVHPDADGAWAVDVPAGDYEIVMTGPDGFEPQVFTPVSAVPR